MENFEFKQYIVGALGTNCYFLCNMDTKAMIIVDPGDQAEVLKMKIRESGCTPVAILLTHGHFDHIMASNQLRETYGIPVYAHELEKEFMEGREDEIARQFTGNSHIGATIDEFIHGDAKLEIAGFDIQVYSTPGHSPGSCCYYLAEQKILLSGDTLFCGSVGRTDFPGGSMSALIHSVEDKLFTLPEETKVYPGHEQASSIAYEKKFNPYF